MSARTHATSRPLSVLLVALVGLVLLPVGSAHASSANGSRPGEGTDGATPPGKAWVRAGHFVSGMDPVSIQLQPQSGSMMKLAQRVAYGSVTQYRQIPPGKYTVAVRPEGAASDTQPMLRRTLSVSAGKASTIALLGKQSAPRLATLSDDLSSPRPGTARVRVLSGSADAPKLSIKAIGGPDIASDVVLGQTTGYASVPEGSWTLALDEGDAGTVQKTVDLASGGVYTAVVLDGDNKSDGAVRLSLVTDAQGVARTPKGAAATGLGGAATVSGPLTSVGAGSWPLGLLGAGVALIGSAVLVGRRGSRRPATSR